MSKRTVGIFTYGVAGQNPWDPESVRSGITGSEEAVIYMSKELSNLGYQVLVFGDPPLNSPHSLKDANPRFLSRNDPISRPLDIAIAWRWPEIGSHLKVRGIARKAYLWPHDTIDYPAPAEGFDGVLWLSEWQRKQWMSLNPNFERFTEIFGNGIEPKQFRHSTQKENPYSCIYGSNYGRGLEILLQIWPIVKGRFPRATLDIYYGWQHWGLLAPGVERWMRAAVHRLPDVKEHGLIGHEELNLAYAKASFWTYPCIKPETFCITALRAQLSGAVPVILEGSALGETVQSGFRCQRREEFLSLWLDALSSAEKISQEERTLMGRFVLEKYTWEKVALQWQRLFD